MKIHEKKVLDEGEHVALMLPDATSLSDYPAAVGANEVTVNGGIPEARGTITTTTASVITDGSSSPPLQTQHNTANSAALTTTRTLKHVAELENTDPRNSGPLLSSTASSSNQISADAEYDEWINDGYEIGNTKLNHRTVLSGSFGEECELTAEARSGNSSKSALISNYPNTSDLANYEEKIVYNPSKISHYESSANDDDLITLDRGTPIEPNQLYYDVESCSQNNDFLLPFSHAPPSNLNSKSAETLVNVNECVGDTRIPISNPILIQSNSATPVTSSERFSISKSHTPAPHKINERHEVDYLSVNDHKEKPSEHIDSFEQSSDTDCSPCHSPQHPSSFFRTPRYSFRKSSESALICKSIYPPHSVTDRLVSNRSGVNLGGVRRNVFNRGCQNEQSVSLDQNRRISTGDLFRGSTTYGSLPIPTPGHHLSHLNPENYNHGCCGLNNFAHTTGTHSTGCSSNAFTEVSTEFMKLHGFPGKRYNKLLTSSSANSHYSGAATNKDKFTNNTYNDGGAFGNGSKQTSVSIVSSGLSHFGPTLVGGGLISRPNANLVRNSSGLGNSGGETNQVATAQHLTNSPESKISSRLLRKEQSAASLPIHPNLHIRESSRSPTAGAAPPTSPSDPGTNKPHAHDGAAFPSGRVLTFADIADSNYRGTSDKFDNSTKFTSPIWNRSGGRSKLNGRAISIDVEDELNRNRANKSESGFDLDNQPTTRCFSLSESFGRTGSGQSNAELLGSNYRKKMSMVMFGSKKIPKALRDQRKQNLDHAGNRLGYRKRIFSYRTTLCDASLFLGLLGILLMVIESEYSVQGVNLKRTPISLVLRSLIVLSTIVLLVLITIYHACELKLVMIDGGTDDWRVAITWDKLTKLLMELCICAVTPLPGTGFTKWPYLVSTSSSGVTKVSYVQVPVDILLSIPMFFRFYLIGRVMVMRSRLFQDAATRSIAALNRISVDFKFVLKTMMQEKPTTVLVTFTVCFWVVMSWMLTQCERYTPELNQLQLAATQSSGRPSRTFNSAFNYFNSLWLIVITFMSIGYGDVVPHTYCGRAVAITTGIMGIGVASALVAVISRKLELSLAERHVNSFLADTKLEARRKHTAARVLQQMWHIYKYRFLESHSDDLIVRKYQRKFLKAIHDFRRVKWEQRRQAEQSHDLVDVAKVQTELQQAVYDMHQNQQELIVQLGMMTSHIEEVCRIARKNSIISMNNSRQSSGAQAPIYETNENEEDTPDL